jgi:HK97 family phage prohead protease
MERKLLNSTCKALADQRLVTVICSTSDPDRMGDVIVQSGIDLAAYRKNPVVLWGHCTDAPIARASEIGIKDGKLQATVKFPLEGDDEDSDWVYGKIKSGIVNATSVGFLPRNYEPLDPKQPWAGMKFLKSELLEFSFVSVPANSGCLIVGRSLYNGVDIPLLPSLARSSGGLRAARDRRSTTPMKRDSAISRWLRVTEARELAAKARSISASISDGPAPTREQRIAEAKNFRAMLESGG